MSFEDALPAIREDLHRVVGHPFAAPARRSEGTACLVTGASGFFGAALASALLEQSTGEVVCLVRADDDAHARARVLARLRRHAPELGDDPARLTAVAGDVTRPGLGLSERNAAVLSPRVRRVFHAAADVNGTLPYAALRDANVVAPLHVCDFASRAGADLHHVSTMAAAVPAQGGPEPDVPLHALPSGYAQSKWVSEQVMAAYRRAAPDARTHTYRLGALSGHTVSGTANPSDFRWLFLRACLALEAAPLIEGGLCWLPVDCAAAVVARAALAPAAPSSLPDPLPVTATGAVPWPDVFSWLRLDGHRLRVVTAEGWWDELNSRLLTTVSDDLAAFAGFQPGLPSARARGDDRVWRALRDLGAPETPFDRAQLSHSLRVQPSVRGKVSRG